MAKKGTKVKAKAKTKTKAKVKVQDEELDWYEEIGGDLARQLSSPSDSAIEYFAKSTISTVTGLLVIGLAKMGVDYVKDTMASKEEDNKNVIDIAS